MRYHPNPPFARELWAKLVLEGGAKNQSDEVWCPMGLEYRLIRAMAERLLPVEAYVLTRHYADKWSLNDIGESMAPEVSREWVRHLEDRALQKLRRPSIMQYIAGMRDEFPGSPTQIVQATPRTQVVEKEPLSEATSVRELELTTRSKNALWNAKIRTVGELLQANLRHIPQLGTKSRRETEEMIESLKKILGDPAE